MTDISNTTRRLNLIEKYISRMPSLSTTVTKVLEICNSPNASPNDLNRVICLDPVLTGKVLKLINSAYYSLVDQVTSVTRGIILLGINTVKNLVISTAVLETAKGNRGHFQALSMDDFWAHSICVGVTAKSLAQIKNLPPALREEYFLAGLLHDLGKIPLNNRFPKEYGQALQLAREKDAPLRWAEDMTFGIDHCVVGRMIAEKWNLSGALHDSICHHHSPEEARDENRQLIAVVALADSYAIAFEAGTPDEFVSREPNLQNIHEQAGLSLSAFSGLDKEVLEEMEKARVFLQIAKKG